MTVRVRVLGPCVTVSSRHSSRVDDSPELLTTFRLGGDGRGHDVTSQDCLGVPLHVFLFPFLTNPSSFRPRLGHGVYTGSGKGSEEEIVYLRGDREDLEVEGRKGPI